jgi:hypothetical protein
MFAITSDSIFKVDSYARTAIAISSAACGVGIACDVWFLLRYSWVDLRTFIVRPHPNPTSSQSDIVPRSTVLTTYMIHMSSSPCPLVYPRSARWFLPSHSRPS